jgi:hypothetical protein
MKQSKLYAKVAKCINWLTNPIIEKFGVFCGLITFQVVYVLIYLWGIKTNVDVYESLKETQRLFMYGFVFAWAILLIRRYLGKMGGNFYAIFSCPFHIPVCRYCMYFCYA